MLLFLRSFLLATSRNNVSPHNRITKNTKHERTIPPKCVSSFSTDVGTPLTTQSIHQPPTQNFSESPLHHKMHPNLLFTLIPFLGSSFAFPLNAADTYALATCNPTDPTQYIIGTKPTLLLSDCATHCWCNCGYDNIMCFVNDRQAPTMTWICKNGRAGNCECGACP